MNFFTCFLPVYPDTDLIIAHTYLGYLSLRTTHYCDGQMVDELTLPDLPASLSCGIKSKGNNHSKVPSCIPELRAYSTILPTYLPT